MNERQRSNGSDQSQAKNKQIHPFLIQQDQFQKDQQKKKQLEEWLIKTNPSIKQIVNDNLLEDIFSYSFKTFGYLNRRFTTILNQSKQQPVKFPKQYEKPLISIIPKYQDEFLFIIIRGIAMTGNKPEGIFIYIEAVCSEKKSEKLFVVQGTRPPNNMDLQDFVNISKNVQQEALGFRKVFEKDIYTGQRVQYNILTSEDLKSRRFLKKKKNSLKRDNYKSAFRFFKVQAPIKTRTKQKKQSIKEEFLELNYYQPTKAKKSNISKVANTLNKRISSLKAQMKRKLIQSTSAKAHTEKDINSDSYREDQQNVKNTRPSQGKPKNSKNNIQFITNFSNQSKKILRKEESTVTWQLFPEFMMERKQLEQLIKEELGGGGSILIVIDSELLENLGKFRAINCENFQFIGLIQDYHSTLIHNLLKNFQKTQFYALRELSISHIQLTTIEPIGNLQMPNIREIDLSFNYIIDLGPIRNIDSDQLESINLDGNNLLYNLEVLTEVDWPKLQFFSCFHINMAKNYPSAISYRKMMKMKKVITGRLLWMIEYLNEFEWPFENNLLEVCEKEFE